MRQLLFDSAELPAIVVLFLWIFGCATPYQKKGFSGGYEDARIRDNIYYVDLQTNAYTSQVTAAQYFHRRVKEICLENGYSDYRIFNERNSSGAYGTYGGGTASVTQKSGFSGYAECLGRKK
ncbi:MAG TPA: hypothetical protein VMB78_11155 [Dissulfurispiraceae bacterium]|nr:hypothetical protein [Dissulfurispiraceae bacterium]